MEVLNLLHFIFPAPILSGGFRNADNFALFSREAQSARPRARFDETLPRWGRKKVARHSNVESMRDDEQGVRSVGTVGSRLWKVELRQSARSAGPWSAKRLTSSRTMASMDLRREWRFQMVGWRGSQGDFQLSIARNHTPRLLQSVMTATASRPHFL